MIKKLVLVSAIVSQLLVSCSKQDVSPEETVVVTNSTDLINLPYSGLTPEQQKVKLENDANALLTMLDKSKTSNAVEAIQNLERLLEIDAIDYLGGRTNNNINDLLNISNAYGIYTWNNTMQKWIKTNSTTELKFVFPAKKIQTANNTVLSSNGISSGIKIDIVDSDEVGYWAYNPVTGQYTYQVLTPAVKDQFELPASVNSSLKIDNTEVATLRLTNTFSGGRQVPDSSNFSATTNDGYALSYDFAKGASNSFNLNFKLDSKNIISFNNGSTSKIDDLIAGNNLPQYLGRSNTLIEFSDNIVIIGNQDTEAMQNTLNTLENSLVRPNYFTSTYYSDMCIYNKRESEGIVSAVGNNTRLALVSKKDGTKIADIIYKSVKRNSSIMPYVWNSTSQQWQYTTNGGQILDEYEEVPYLKFNDNTMVEMEVYFSTGFTTLQTNYNNYIAAFRR